MVTPNEHGVYVEGLERLKYRSKRAQVEIKIAHCYDGKWRFGLYLRLQDKFETSSGYGSPASLKSKSFDSRRECVINASKTLGGMLARDWNNPKAVAEVKTWLSRLSPPKEGQLALFGVEA